MLSLPLTACSCTFFSTFLICAGKTNGCKSSDFRFVLFSDSRSEVGLDGESRSCHIFSVELREPVLLQRLSLRTTLSDRAIAPSSIRILRDRSTFLNSLLTGGESQNAFDSSLVPIVMSHFFFSSLLVFKFLFGSIFSSYILMGNFE
jgi:hypothetical protein